MAFPFDEVAAELGPPFTGASILQHLLKMRKKQVTTPAKNEDPIHNKRSRTKPSKDYEDSAERQEVPAERVGDNNMKRSTKAGMMIARRLILMILCGLT